MIRPIVSEKGFTLIELLVAISIFTILASFMMSSLVFSLRSNFDAQVRYEAVQAGQQVLDAIRFDEIASLPGGPGTVVESPPRTITIGARQFEVEVTYCKKPSLCPEPYTSRHVSVKVLFNTKKIYETETVYTELGQF